MSFSFEKMTVSLTVTSNDAVDKDKIRHELVKQSKKKVSKQKISTLHKLEIVVYLYHDKQ